MKVFERDGKTNFVDDNNVLVGFDAHQCCCEDFGWSLTPEFPTSIVEGTTEGVDPEGYQFDPNYCEYSVPGVDDKLDCGGVVVFRLTKADDTIFLMLWNCHNGYYSHGFNMTCDGKELHGGDL